MSFLARPAPEPAPDLRAPPAPEVERLLASCLRSAAASSAASAADPFRPAATQAEAAPARAFLIAGRMVRA